MMKPTVILKLAQTLDGCIATASGDSKWITTEASRREGHRLRAEVDAILVGAGTVRADDPELSVRLVDGNSPIKIVLDAHLTLPLNAKIFEGAPLILVAGKDVDDKRKAEREALGVQVWCVDVGPEGLLDLKAVVLCAAQAGIQRILIEGGSRVAASALKVGVVDDVVVFVAPKIVGSGLSAVGDLGIDRIADAICLKNIDVLRIGNDVMYRAQVDKES